MSMESVAQQPIPSGTTFGKEVDTNAQENQLRIENIDSTQRQSVLRQYADTMTIATRSVSDSTFAQFESDSDYQYDSKLPENAISWWDIFIAWLKRHLFGITETSSSALSGFITFLKYSFILLFCILMGILLARANATGLLFGRRKTIDVQHDEVEENITEVDLNMLHRSALSDENYRKAVRYLYLIALRDMNNKTLIEWQPSKTNKQFLRELSGTPLHKPFRDIVRVFNFVWYGEFTIDKTAYSEIEKLFSSFTPLIEQQRGMPNLPSTNLEVGTA